MSWGKKLFRSLLDLDLALRYRLPYGSRENSLWLESLTIFWGLPLTPPGIEALDGRKLGPGDVLGRLLTMWLLTWKDKIKTFWECINKGQTKNSLSALFLFKNRHVLYPCPTAEWEYHREGESPGQALWPRGIREEDQASREAEERCESLSTLHQLSSFHMERSLRRKKPFLDVDQMTPYSLYSALLFTRVHT